MPNTDTEQSSFPGVGLFRRLMAISYDIFLLMAILFLATALVNATNQGQAIDQSTLYTLFLRLFLGALIILYFGWFWIHGGQTLGMKTWKIKLISNDSQTINWKQALIREITAIFSWLCLGLGFFWSVFDKNKRSWHDISSNTTLIDLRATDTSSL
jgi:uncharacterized RDD family membrane protein YckC